MALLFQVKDDGRLRDLEAIQRRMEQHLDRPNLTLRSETLLRRTLLRLEEAIRKERAEVFVDLLEADSDDELLWVYFFVIILKIFS